MAENQPMDVAVEEKKELSVDESIESVPVGNVEEENAQEEKEAKDGSNIDPSRIHITNLPKMYGHKQFKKLIERSLPMKARKVRQVGTSAYISLDSPEEAQKALEILREVEIKRTKLICKLAVAEPVRAQAPRIVDENSPDFKPKTARETVTPLADMPYEEQLELKNKECLSILNKLIVQMRRGNCDVPKPSQIPLILGKIKASPKITGYRNKCEFTVGTTLSGKICVGFVGGRYSQNMHYVIPADEVTNITDHSKAIVKEFTNFVVESGLPPLNEFTRTGFWKILTIREFGGDAMLIVSVASTDDTEKEAELKKQLCDRFMKLSSFSEHSIRVTSIYWQSTNNISDVVPYEHLAGVPYIYENVLDCRFRVSPSAFFQTNSQAAAVLYTQIGYASGLIKEQSEVQNEPTVAAEAVEDPNEGAKRIKLDPEAEAKEESAPVKEATKKTVILDICCGTGTIGQCLMKAFGDSENTCCVGIEMIESAVDDANQNCKINNLENQCKYIAGKAEEVFRSLRSNLPEGFSLDDSNVVGILDPPRAGLHEKVIMGCRQMSSLRRIVFVSCDPAAAMKNIVDLCREPSKKYGGIAFDLTHIQPVDMFPQTKHVEWVITLDR